jgi:Uma2 family endonuclease
MVMSAHPITVEQYEASFERVPGFHDELINGRIVTTPDAKPLHQQIQRNIQRLLDAACEGTPYTVNGGSNIKFPALHSMPSPDVFVVPTDKWEAAAESNSYLEGPPLIAVEILSPDQNADEKVDIYRRAGVKSIWVVDPRERSVLVYSQDSQYLYPDGDRIGLPFPLSVEIGVADIFVKPSKR